MVVSATAASARLFFMSLAAWMIVHVYHNELLLDQSLPRSRGISNLHTPEPMTESESITKEQTDTTKCYCRKQTWAYKSRFLDYLENWISWLNMTEESHINLHHPNLPLDLFKNAVLNPFCHLMPHLFTVEWRNKFWQEVKVWSTVYQLYSASYDDRKLAEIRPCVRVLAVSSDSDPAYPYCHLWFNVTGPPEVSRVEKIDYNDWQEKSEPHLIHKAYLLSCRIPSTSANLVPLAVSIVEQPCLVATNILKVTGAKERDKSTAFVNGVGPTDDKGLKGWSVAVCGPALYYYHNDMSVRLVEWLEIYKALGFSKALFYVTDVHPNILKVLSYYEKEGFVDMVKFSYPAPYMDEESLRRLWTKAYRRSMFALENVYFTDCILRNMHRYRFMAHFDPDEIPILHNHKNYTEFIDHLLESNEENKLPGSYLHRWHYHCEDLEPSYAGKDLPAYLFALRHNQRPKTDPTIMNAKSLYDSNRVKTVYSHTALSCIPNGCSPRKMDVENVYLAHYRLSIKSWKNDTELVEENFLLKYASQLQKSVPKILSHLNLE